MNDLLVLHASHEVSKPVYPQEVLELLDKKDGVLINDLTHLECLARLQPLDNDAIDLVQIWEALANVDDVNE